MKVTLLKTDTEEGLYLGDKLVYKAKWIHAHDVLELIAGHTILETVVEDGYEIWIECVPESLQEFYKLQEDAK